MTKYQEVLSQILESSLGIRAGEMDVNLGFSELGLDSLTGLRLCRKIQETLGVNIDPIWLYDYPSVSQLAEFLSQHYRHDNRGQA